MQPVLIQIKNVLGRNLSEEINIAYYSQNKGRMTSSIPVETDEVSPKSQGTRGPAIPWQMNLITVLCYLQETLTKGTWS